MVCVAVPDVPLRLSNVTHTTPWLSAVYSLLGSCTQLPVLGKLVTGDQVTPESVLRHMPLPLGAPKYRMLFLLGSMASRSPMPRPGMLPPSLIGNGDVCHVVPLSLERRMAPLSGSQLFVYMPAATYTLFGSTGSVARLATPLSPQLVKPTQSSSGTQRFVVASSRYAPPMSVRA